MTAPNTEKAPVNIVTIGSIFEDLNAKGGGYRARRFLIITGVDKATETAEANAFYTSDPTSIKQAKISLKRLMNTTRSGLKQHA